MGCTTSSHIGSNISYTKSRKAISAAILIQKWYRSYVARLEIRRRYTWTIFQSIEYAGEQDQIKLYNFYNSILTQMNPDQDGYPKLIKIFNQRRRTSTVVDMEEEEELLRFTSPSQIHINSSYNGPHLSFPLSLSQLHKLVQAFRRKQSLHARYFIQILLEARLLLKQKPNISKASTSISSKITVCGDLHGKLGDLYMIFHKNGLPAVDNPYIFNGDFVDRGAFSVEVIIILFCCFLLHPNEVYLNRGNHEDPVMNIRYGFVKEIHAKYEVHAKKILRLMEDVFSWLPLATVIDNQILVAHGGISDTVDLDFLEKIDRHRFVSIMEPPRGFSEDITNIPQEVLVEWKQILDLLWSDPRHQLGCTSNTFRGGGSYFGPDVTECFLKKHNLKMLIRSHECKQEGYEYSHNGMVLTVFSASNYYEYGSNRGAYVTIHGPEHRCHFVQYMSHHSPSLRKITFTQRVCLTETSAIDDLRERIVSSKSELTKEFRQYDTDNTGKISVNDWCFCMEMVLEMGLPWRTLRPRLVQIDNSDGCVLWETTFEQLSIRNRYSGNGPSITETLYRHKDNLETIFMHIDRDNSGYISMNEFEDAFGLLSQQLDIHFGDQEIKEIASCLDINKDGKIDFNEFLEAFRIVDRHGKDKVPKTSSLETTDSSDLLTKVKGMVQKEHVLIEDEEER
ncbi:hypothetical protein CHS0354_012601 [Potamilus streckersoni]|uniref:Serine/threonine-protein phosphatase with EF-hands n=1 Tax=Potamilus streckersoni TaxID=2493646 RepID=A0AAE0W4I1_9BIVA|nr:hypothetical protein CHS0354_012601 [Potamilus streckersoni]